MRIAVRVRPGSKAPGIERRGDSLIVRVKEPALDGKANAACERALAEYFGVSRSEVRLLRGSAAREKLFEIG